MDGYQIPPSLCERGLQVTVGWSAYRSGYYALVRRATKTARVVMHAGASRADAISNIDELEQILEKFARLSPDLRSQLIADRRAHETSKRSDTRISAAAS